MQTSLRLTLILALTIIAGCKSELNEKELINKFYQNKPAFDSIVYLAQHDRTLDSALRIGADNGLPAIQFSYPQIFWLITSSGITHVSSHANIYRPSGRWYYLKTNWAKDYPIYLIYNYIDYNFKSNNEFVLDSSENIKGFYKIDTNKNETWGLGNKWKMFRLVKEIEVKM
ncbi:MAG: hypothetical protein QM726_12440 [Chitinophagaceae bacterium]